MFDGLIVSFSTSERIKIKASGYSWKFDAEGTTTAVTSEEKVIPDMQTMSQTHSALKSCVITARIADAATQ